MSGSLPKTYTSNSVIRYRRGPVVARVGIHATPTSGDTLDTVLVRKPRASGNRMDSGFSGD